MEALQKYVIYGGAGLAILGLLLNPSFAHANAAIGWTLAAILYYQTKEMIKWLVEAGAMRKVE